MSKSHSTEELACRLLNYMKMCAVNHPRDRTTIAIREGSTHVGTKCSECNMQDDGSMSDCLSIQCPKVEGLGTIPNGPWEVAWIGCSWGKCTSKPRFILGVGHWMFIAREMTGLFADWDGAQRLLWRNWGCICGICQRDEDTNAGHAPCVAYAHEFCQASFAIWQLRAFLGWPARDVVNHISRALAVTLDIWKGALDICLSDHGVFL